jgi:hypothetical protein
MNVVPCFYRLSTYQPYVLQNRASSFLSNRFDRIIRSVYPVLSYSSVGSTRDKTSSDPSAGGEGTYDVVAD